MKYRINRETLWFLKTKTWRFIKQLEAKDLIWGYTAIFDEEKIGLTIL